MKEILIAAIGTIRSEDGYVVLALGESPSGAGRHMMVSRLLEQNGAAAEDEPYSLSTEHGLTTEGGIEGWGIREGVLSLVLSAEAAETLGLPSELQMVLSDPASTERVRRAMAWLIDPQSPVPEDVFLPSPHDGGRMAST